ncbi:MAG TPA: SDR family oxidoreductase [Steroidobacteraceae bacterium]|nr:SDR family oxidoreductase [Steroidobacteraceae bacterium]
MKSVVVTGGSRGIGLAIAKRFASDGFEVCIVAREREALTAAAAQIGTRTTIEAADVSSRADVERVTGAIAARYGRLDVLVNNAGILETVPVGTPLAEAEALFDRVVDVSLKGAFLMSHALAPLLASPGGRIVNMGSIVAQSGASVPGYTAYTPAKAGLHGLTLALARELGPQGITVNTVAPGMTADTGQTIHWDETRTASIRAQIPLGRLGAVDDVANAVVWLASSEASYITGMTLPVNGGWRFY